MIGAGWELVPDLVRFHPAQWRIDCSNVKQSIMSLGSGSSAGFVFGSLPAPAYVAERVHAELHQLLRLRQEIEERMRSLSHTLLGLQLGVGRRTRGSLSPRSPLSTAGSANAVHAGVRITPHGGRSRLKRACRIALLEAGAAASPQEIYARILRRGSYFFGEGEPPIQAVARALASVTRTAARS